MNREKKEEKRKYHEARRGLSADEILALDLEDEINKKIENLARILHAETFPEEYDCIGDSICDAKARAKGMNPMRQEYIEKVTKRRSRLGVSELAKNGLPISDDSYRLCLEKAKLQILNEIVK